MSGGSEQPAGELAPVRRRARVVRAEQLEDVDVLLAGLVVVAHPVEQAGRAWRRSRRSARRRAGPAPPRGAPARSRGCGPAAPGPPRSRPARPAARPAPTTASSLPGSSSSAWRRLSSSPAATSAASASSSADGKRRSTNSRTVGSGWAPRNPSTGWPSFTATTSGMLCTPKAWAICGFSSTLTLTSTTLPSVSSITFSMIGPRVRHGPHHGAQRSTTTGTSLDRSITSVSKVASVTSTAAMREKASGAPARSVAATPPAGRTRPPSTAAQVVLALSEGAPALTTLRLWPRPLTSPAPTTSRRPTSPMASCRASTSPR